MHNVYTLTDYDAVGRTVIALRNGAEPLLAGCIPDLYLTE